MIKIRAYALAALTVLVLGGAAVIASDACAQNRRTCITRCADGWCSTWCF